MTNQIDRNKAAIRWFVSSVNKSRLIVLYLISEMKYEWNSKKKVFKSLAFPDEEMVVVRSRLLLVIVSMADNFDATYSD